MRVCLKGGGGHRNVSACVISSKDIVKGEPANTQQVKFFLCLRARVYCLLLARLYTVSQEERSVFWEVTRWAIIDEP
jgi:hypothetical protein